MKVIPNLLSLARIPLALLFLFPGYEIRLIALFLAWFSDIADGYLARKWKNCSFFGTLIDPLSDKFFALFCFYVLYIENKIDPLDISLLLSRDVALIVFGIYLFIKNEIRKSKVQAFISGKLVTGIQFLVLTGLTIGYSIPKYTYVILIFLGISSLYELIRRQRHFSRN